MNGAKIHENPDEDDWGSLIFIRSSHRNFYSDIEAGRNIFARINFVPGVAVVSDVIRVVFGSPGKTRMNCLFLCMNFSAPRANLQGIS